MEKKMKLPNDKLDIINMLEDIKFYLIAQKIKAQRDQNNNLSEKYEELNKTAGYLETKIEQLSED